MKLIIAVVQDTDANRLLNALMKDGYRATKLASTGGFLREGNTTFLIGTEDDKVDDVLQIIERTCRSRTQLVTPATPLGGAPGAYASFPVEVVVGGATVFVVNVERFEKL